MNSFANSLDRYLTQTPEEYYGTGGFINFSDDVFESVLDEDITHQEYEEHEEQLEKWVEMLHGKGRSRIRAARILTRAFRIYLEKAKS